jgi:Fe2+ transport system protein FeoA
VATAGPDQSANEFNTITLDGTDSADPKGGVLSYLWEQTAGTVVVLSDEQSAQPTFVAPDVGSISETLTFKLTVVDEDGLESADTTSVTVVEEGLPLFTDVIPGFWAEDYIYAIFSAGITTGCYSDPLLYCPYDLVNRAQMAAFIVRAVEGEPPADYCETGSPFSDVPSTHPMCKYIKRLSELGITTGYSDGTYRPTLSVNRAQMAAFIVRAVEGEPPADYCETGSPFTDIDSNLPMCKYIKRLFELGITTGYSDGTYRPTLFVNRTQMAAFLARAFLGME